MTVSALPFETGLWLKSPINYNFIIIRSVSWPPIGTVLKLVGLESDTVIHILETTVTINLVSLNSLICHITCSIGTCIICLSWRVSGNVLMNSSAQCPTQSKHSLNANHSDGFLWAYTCLYSTEGNKEFAT